MHKEKGSEIGELLLTVLFYLHVESELTVIASVLETMQTHMITAVYEKIFTSKQQNDKWMMIKKIYFFNYFSWFIDCLLKVYLKHINEF